MRCLDFRKAIENISLNFAFMEETYITDCIDIYLNHLIKLDKNKENFDLVIKVIKGYKCSIEMLFNLYEYYSLVDLKKIIKGEIINRKNELIPREYDLHKKELLLYYKYLYYCCEIVDLNSEEINKDFIEILKFYKIYFVTYFQNYFDLQFENIF